MAINFPANPTIGEQINGAYKLEVLYNLLDFVHQI